MNVMALIKMMDVFPGAKTYMTAAFALSMMVCQMMGYHVFTPEAWGAVGVTGGIFYKMGQDRKV